MRQDSCLAALKRYYYLYIKQKRGYPISNLLMTT